QVLAGHHLTVRPQRALLAPCGRGHVDLYPGMGIATQGPPGAGGLVVRMSKDPEDAASCWCHGKSLPVSDHGLGPRAASYTCWWHERPTPPGRRAWWDTHRMHDRPDYGRDLLERSARMGTCSCRTPALGAAWGEWNKQGLVNNIYYQKSSQDIF